MESTKGTGSGPVPSRQAPAPVASPVSHPQKDLYAIRLSHAFAVPGELSLVRGRNRFLQVIIVSSEVPLSDNNSQKCIWKPNDIADSVLQEP